MKDKKWFSKEDNNFRKTIIALLNDCKYQEAENNLYNKIAELSSLNNNSKKSNILMLAEIAGFLIDIGDEGLCANALKRGFDIINSNINILKSIICEGSLEYNLGNAKHAEFKISVDKQGFSLQLMNSLTEAKNHYWKSYKIFLRKNELPPYLLVNLANTLSDSGRVIEAIQYHDMVLEKYPDFPQANASRSNQLMYFSRFSDGLSVTLVLQSIDGYEKALVSNGNNLSISMCEEIRTKVKSLKNHLDSINYDYNDKKVILEDHILTMQERNTLSHYRLFSIDNSLSLSEHAVYCSCVGARRDDLTIALPNVSMGGDFVPMMELLLNRLKSEFSLSRLLFYYAVSGQKSSDNDFYEKEIIFTELYDNEKIGIKEEMLRTSFRLCFGIFDKIAKGICQLYKLAKPNEQIYFDKFWKSPNKRWETILNINENPGLTALYSLATDINQKHGEWGFYKEWRNALEHNLLFLTDSTLREIDIFKVTDSYENAIRVDYSEFKNKALHLLQLVRSAIFYFVFMVRVEGFKLKEENCNEKSINIPIILSPKSLEN